MLKRQFLSFGVYRLILLTIFFNASFNAQAQRPFFNLIESKLHIQNPAFAGLSYAPRFSFGSRSQWASNPASYLSVEASYDQYFNQISGGVYGHLVFDKAGEFFSRQEGNVGYAYQLQLSDNLALRGGLNIGFISQNFSGGTLFADQIDPLNGSVDANGNPIRPTESLFSGASRTALNAGLGIGVLSNIWFFSATAQQLNTPSFDLSKRDQYQLNMLYAVTAGYGFSLRPDYAYTPIYLLPIISYVQQNPDRRALFKVLLRSEIWTIGGGIQSNLTNQSAFISQAGLKFSKFNIQYAFGIPLNGIGLQSSGSHEISIQFTQDKKPFLRSIRGKGVYCPAILQ